MVKYDKNSLLKDLKSDVKNTKHQSGLLLAQNGDLEGFSYLVSIISDPPRVNGPDHVYFKDAVAGLVQFITQFGHQLAEQDLKHLATLKDVSKDVVYYLEDDPLYDVGHDFIHADFSAVRHLAREKLNQLNRQR